MRKALANAKTEFNFFENCIWNFGSSCEKDCRHQMERGETKQKAEKVIFTYEKAPADAEYVYDVSADRVGTKDNPTTADANSTVVLWEDPENADTFYVSTQRNGQEIKFNKMSSKMFYKCQYLTDAIFFNVDTSNMVYADDMFAYDTALKELDLSSWTTGRLNSTTEMFANSGLLKRYILEILTKRFPSRNLIQPVSMSHRNRQNTFMLIQIQMTRIPWKQGSLL